MKPKHLITIKPEKLIQKLGVFIFFLISIKLQAFTYHEISGSTRNRSLGGCGVAVSSPYDSYYNPACLIKAQANYFSTTSLWALKMIKSPNYYIDDQNNWIPFDERSDWKFLPMITQFGAVFENNYMTLSPAIMLIGGWQTLTPFIQRQRGCIAISLSLAFELFPGLRLGISPQYWQMVDFNNNEIHSGFGGNLVFGFLYTINHSWDLGLSVMPPTFMYWPVNHLAFKAADSGMEQEPLILRAGLAYHQKSLLFSIATTYMAWHYYDSEARDIWQFHLGFEHRGFSFPIRLGLFNEPHPWSPNIHNLIFTLGSAMSPGPFTINYGVEFACPLSEISDRLVALFLTVSF